MGSCFNAALGFIYDDICKVGVHMDLISIFDLVTEFLLTFRDSVIVFVIGLQWFFTNLTIILNSFFSLLSFVTMFLTFVKDFLLIVPSWLLPFPLAVLSYWLIMFIIKQGGKS